MIEGLHSSRRSTTTRNRDLSDFWDSSTRPSIRCPTIAKLEGYAARLIDGKAHSNIDDKNVWGYNSVEDHTKALKNFYGFHHVMERFRDHAHK
jgi:hypothetical protein